jgi:hypothetical protein
MNDTSATGRPAHLDDTILHQLQRRPATIEELSSICGATINDIAVVINLLISRGDCDSSMVDGRKYYTLKTAGSR